MSSINALIAKEIGANHKQVEAAVDLLDQGSTVPFIARYRKEATGGLDDTQLRNLEQRLNYLRELDDRRNSILKSIQQQEKLTPALQQEILQAQSKTALEDLYLPYKQKRRTKGTIAIEAGLEPLADKLLNNPNLDPEAEAIAFINPDKQLDTNKAVLDGAKYILMERFAVDARLIDKTRTYLQQNATLESKVAPGKEQEGAKFKDYFEYSELISKIPSHRALALLRGRNEGILQLNLNADPNKEDKTQASYCEVQITNHLGLNFQDRPADKWLLGVVQWTWRIKLLMQLENELVSNLREQAETEAIKVFGQNLSDLLMAAPAGQKATLGLDPGLRTGVKIAVIDGTGKVLDTDTIYPHAPKNQWDQSIAILAKLCKKHRVALLSIGNGTASRETDKLSAELIKKYPELKLNSIMVSEAGASVYSASELAANEFPNMDVSLRGAVSIARRLQDPLAELVKIEPKAIGVGQYQHDVSQSQLAKNLETVVEDCVNAVGVDVNTASAALLTHVAGLNKTLAKNIVDYRDELGSFANRKQLKKVPRLGPKAFEQCAGFLRICNGDNPLDASAVHPEAYPVVQRILKSTTSEVSQVIGNRDFLRQLSANDYTDEKFGLPTVTDIIQELDKPGRDPRPEFKTASFKEGVEKLTDLEPGMKLEGVVTNVTNFGAFVDVGVHQDGLVHISSLADKFVSDPREIVKAGDIVKVKVMELDVQRKRISLSMRMNEEVSTKPQGQRPGPKGKQPKKQAVKQASKPAASNAFAEAFKNAKVKR